MSGYPRLDDVKDDWNESDGVKHEVQSAPENVKTQNSIAYL